MQFQELLGDHQAEPRSLEFAAPCVVELQEGFANALDLIGAHSYSRILNGNIDAA